KRITIFDASLFFSLLSGEGVDCDQSSLPCGHHYSLCNRVHDLRSCILGVLERLLGRFQVRPRATKIEEILRGQNAWSAAFGTNRSLISCDFFRRDHDNSGSEPDYGRRALLSQQSRNVERLIALLLAIFAALLARLLQLL